MVLSPLESGSRKRNLSATEDDAGSASRNPTSDDTLLYHTPNSLCTARLSQSPQTQPGDPVSSLILRVRPPLESALPHLDDRRVSTAVEMFEKLVHAQFPFITPDEHFFGDILDASKSRGTWDKLTSPADTVDLLAIAFGRASCRWKRLTEINNSEEVFRSCPPGGHCYLRAVQNLRTVEARTEVRYAHTLLLAAMVSDLYFYKEENHQYYEMISTAVNTNAYSWLSTGNPEEEAKSQHFLHACLHQYNEHLTLCHHSHTLFSSDALRILKQLPIFRDSPHQTLHLLALQHNALEALQPRQEQQRVEDTISTMQRLRVPLRVWPGRKGPQFHLVEYQIYLPALLRVLHSAHNQEAVSVAANLCIKAAVSYIEITFGRRYDFQVQHTTVRIMRNITAYYRLQENLPVPPKTPKPDADFIRRIISHLKKQRLANADVSREFCLLESSAP